MVSVTETNRPAYPTEITRQTNFYREDAKKLPAKVPVKNAKIVPKTEETDDSHEISAMVNGSGDYRSVVEQSSVLCRLLTVFSDIGVKNAMNGRETETIGDVDKRATMVIISGRTVVRVEHHLETVQKNSVDVTMVG